MLRLLKDEYPAYTGTFLVKVEDTVDYNTNSFLYVFYWPMCNDSSAALSSLIFSIYEATVANRLSYFNLCN